MADRGVTADEARIQRRWREHCPPRFRGYRLDTSPQVAAAAKVAAWLDGDEPDCGGVVVDGVDVDADVPAPEVEGGGIAAGTWSWTGLYDLTNAPITCEYISTDTTL